jgi:pilus assembly protein CpaC
VSNIDEAAGITLGSIRIPGFRTRRTQTTVSVKEGESFMVGGLLQDEIRSVVQKVPFFGDIPILGALFRSSAYDKDQSELAIIVTPHIVTPTPAGEAIPLPGEGLDRPSTAAAILLGKVVSDKGKRSVIEPGLEVPR